MGDERVSDEHVIDLESVWRTLDAVRDCGALAAQATFLTTHGLVSLISSLDGRAMTVDGQTFPLDDDEVAA